MSEQGRIQDGSINDATDFWQLIMDIGYLMEGESADYALERMKGLGKGLDAFLRAHPEITDHGPDAPLEHFAMHAVCRLAWSFVFNSEVAPRLLMRVVTDEQVLRRLAEQQQLDD